MHEPNLGSLIMFEGDYRSLTCQIANVTTFSSVTGILVQREDDVTSTYCNNSPTYSDNVIKTPKIGDKATMPAGGYRYYLTGVYDGGKKRTWYIEIFVLPKNLSQIETSHFVQKADYNPKINEFVMFEGDIFMLEAFFTGIDDFSAVTGQFRLDDDTSVDAAYCSGSASYSSGKLQSASIGGADTIPAGVYAYFVTGTWGNSEQKTTWYWQVNCSPKES